MKSTAHREQPVQLFHSPADESAGELPLRPLSWRLVVRLFGFARPARKKLILLSGFTAIRSAQIPGLVWLASRVITGPIAHGDRSGVVKGTIAYAALGLLTETMFHFRQRYALEIGETVVRGLRAEIYSSLLRQPLSFFQRIKVGRILSGFTGDLEVVRTGIQDVGFMTAVQLGQMIFSALAMALCDWRLFLVIAAVAPVLWFANLHFRLKLSRLTRESQSKFSAVTAALAESVNGIKVTQGFARQTTNAGLFRRMLIDHSQHNQQLARTAGILTPLLELNTQFFIAVLLLVGGWRTVHSGLPLENLIFIVLMANQFFSPIAVISQLYSQGLAAMGGAERIFWLIDYPPDWTESATVTALPLRIQPGSPREPGGIRVEFSRVSFGYEPARPVLHEIDFTVEPGQTVALVGQTGSGKSSIVNLVAKFHLPTAGEIRLNAREIRTLSRGSIARALGIVPQQNFLFSGTVRDNIRLGRPEATDDEVKAAVEQLGFADLVSALPNGFETEVGENGVKLSVGQRQLICVARAFLPNPRLVILDEATSAIDALTEVRLQAALAQLLRGRTGFVVAHRLSTIRQADLLLVLSQGRVVERGKHAELLARGGHYAALYRQFISVQSV